MKHISILGILALGVAGLGIVGSTALAAGQSAVSTGTASVQAVEQITPGQAQKAAETKVGGVATSVKFESEDGENHYKVLIGDKDVEVDAMTGVVLNVEKPDSASEGDDENETDAK